MSIYSPYERYFRLYLLHSYQVASITLETKLLNYYLCASKTHHIERFGVTIDDRMQEWNIEVDQFTVVNNDSRLLDVSERQQMSPPTYSFDEENNSEDDDSDKAFNDSFEAVFESESDITTPTSMAIPEDSNFEALTIPELKERLRAIGLPVSGKKSELIERLSQSST